MITLKHRVLAWSLSILLIALPLNTLLVQVFIVKLGLPFWVALWKELLAGVVMLICGWEVIVSRKSKVESRKGKHPVSFAATPQEGNLGDVSLRAKHGNPSTQEHNFQESIHPKPQRCHPESTDWCHPELVSGSKTAKVKVFLPIILVMLMTLVGILASIGKVNFSYFIYGFRFELFWVWFWVILAVWGKGERAKFKVESAKIVGVHPTSFGGTPQEGNPLSEHLHNKRCHPELVSGSKTALLIGFLISSFFSIITIIFGTENTLAWLGYGQKALQSGGELLFTQPVGHLIDAGGWNSDFRLSSGFSSPNHYAAYLILLLPLFLYKVFYAGKGKHPVGFATTPQEGNFLGLTLSLRWFWSSCLVLDLVFIALTYARFSYLALFVIFGVLIVVKIQNSKWEVNKKSKEQRAKSKDWEVENSEFRVQSWIKNGILGLIFAVPILISVVILNLPISVLQTHFPSFLSKPSSTEWHQQHTSAAWRALTLQTHPDMLNQTKLSDAEILKLNNLIQRSKNPVAVTYRMMAGYGMATTDPASKYLSLESNPIANLGFGLDDELYFPRVIDRPLALTPENWFLGLCVKGGVFYMMLFLAILVYFMRDIRLLFSSMIETLQDPQSMLKLLVSLSIFGVTIGAFLLDIFDSQSLALLIGPIYLTFRNFANE